MNKKLSTFLNEWRTTFIIGLFVFFLALTLRLYNLTILPIFGDEAIYVRWSQVMNSVPSLRFMPLSDGKQPLFMWVLMFLVNRFSDPLYIARLTSVFYGIGTLIGIFSLSFYLFKNKTVSLISSLFWAISPYSVFFDRLALVDSMLVLMGVWTLFFGVITARTKRLDFAMLTGFTLGGALLTKSPAIYFVIMLPVTWIVSDWPKRKKGIWIGKPEFIHLFRLGGLLFVTYLIAFVMYNSLRLGENFQLIALRNRDYVFPFSHLWENPLNPFKDNSQSAFNYLWVMGPSVLVTFLLFSLIDNLKLKYLKFKERIKPERALLFIWSFFPLVVSAVYAKTFTARYILFVLPTIFIFSSLIFSYLDSKRQLLKRVLVFGLLIFIYQAMYSNVCLLTDPNKMPLPRSERSGYLEEWTAGTGIKEVSFYLRSESTNQPSEKIVVGTEGYFGTLPDGLQLYLNDLPEITVFGSGLDFKEIPVSLVESNKSGNKTYFVVNSTRLKVDYQKLNLKLINAYEKAKKPDGSKEMLYFFEVL